MNRKCLQKFQIKDVVFLAIMSAVALATCAVMPLVISLQPLIFGISQLVTALQIGVFFAIGLYKVRKPGLAFDHGADDGAYPADDVAAHVPLQRFERHFDRAYRAAAVQGI